MTSILVPDLKIEFIPRKVIQFTFIKISFSFVDLGGWQKIYCDNFSRKNKSILVFVTEINKCNKLQILVKNKTYWSKLDFQLTDCQLFNNLQFY